MSKGRDAVGEPLRSHREAPEERETRGNRAVDWTPTAALETLKIRAAILATIRRFFALREVLELETPVLGPGNVPDPEVTGLRILPEELARDDASGHEYLQTSPELFMKRFVAAEGVSCFQITKAFRLAERGRKHNPEFTLLEWYRVGFDTDQLIDEVLELIADCEVTAGSTSARKVQRTTYRQLFSEHCNFDPVLADTQQITQIAVNHGAPMVDRAGALAYLLAAVIEPSFAPGQITVVDRFPADQCALAQISRDSDGVAVAERFEVFVGRSELANGYGELLDPKEQSRRFAHDTEVRAQRDLPDAGTQIHLIAALEHGLPRCSGVALGIDRLLMALLDHEDIASVMSFR